MKEVHFEGIFEASLFESNSTAALPELGHDVVAHGGHPAKAAQNGHVGQRSWRK